MVPEPRLENRAVNGFELWRQDDNGNRFLISTFSSREAAQAELERLEAGGHKQTYWISESGS